MSCTPTPTASASVPFSKDGRRAWWDGASASKSSAKYLRSARTRSACCAPSAAHNFIFQKPRRPSSSAARRTRAMNILVTGGGGFLGKNIVRRLLDRGDRPVVLARGEYPELA